MDIKKTLYALLLVVASNTSQALNPTSGVYGGIIVGVSKELNIDSPFLGKLVTAVANSSSPYAVQAQEILNSGIQASYGINYGVMGLVGGQLGYRWDKYRLEAQFLYNAAPYNSINFSTYQKSFSISNDNTNPNYITGNTYTLAFMCNAYLDLLPPDNVDSSIAPFLGIGAGYASIQNNFGFYYNQTEVPQSSASFSQGAGAGQVMAGVLYFLDDFAYFGLDVRFFSTTKLSSQVPYSQANYYAQFASLNLTFNGAFNFG